MAHEIFPPSGTYLPPATVLGRLQNHFRECVGDANAAREQIDKMLVYGDRVAANGVKLAAEANARLRRGRDSAILISLGEKRLFRSIRLDLLVNPDVPIFIGYSNGREERKLKPLLEKIARALDYEIRIV